MRVIHFIQDVCIIFCIPGRISSVQSSAGPRVQNVGDPGKERHPILSKKEKKKKKIVGYDPTSQSVSIYAQFIPDRTMPSIHKTLGQNTSARLATTPLSLLQHRIMA